ncbi:MAG: NAD-dependent epimerase/dehydratase family protein [Planctomycetota bacterium]|jgi:UDP-glucose 4-epimerase
MRYLITGGAGFIGSHLAERLLAEGDRVVLLDDLSAGSLRNIGQLLASPRASFHRGSARDPQLVAELLADCDGVFHLAASVGVRQVVEQARRVFDNNLACTHAVLQAASSQRKLLVYASSSEVYGKGHRRPFQEDDDLVMGSTRVARWGYACSKAMGEWLALAHQRETGMALWIMRLFNTVGPRQSGRHGMVLPRLVEQAVRGEPMTVYGDGRQTRCFAHVRDVVQVMVTLARRPQASGQVVNIGNDAEVSILALARVVRRLANSTSAIRTVPLGTAYPTGFEEIARRVPDLARLQRLLGAVPTTPLADIVREVVAERRLALAVANG